jgi:NADPH-dependent 2,4-dienoyl-CoA reductase/sulfur reductase-like enzyme
MPVWKNAVIIGGRIAKCQLAEFLVKHWRRVSRVDTDQNLGGGVVPERKNRLLSWFQKKGVVMLTGVTYEQITNGGLTVTTREGKRLTITANTTIPATPMSPNTGLVKALRKRVLEVSPSATARNRD